MFWGCGRVGCPWASVGRIGRTGRTCGAPTIHGLHQPGIATPQLEHGLVAAYDVDDVREVLEAWTATAEAMMRGGGVTVTIGLGPGVFDAGHAAGGAEGAARVRR